MSGNYSSVATQFPEMTSHHSQYAAINTKTSLKGSAGGKVVFISENERFADGVPAILSLIQVGG